jgi:hypothetical protein
VQQVADCTVVEEAKNWKTDTVQGKQQGRLGNFAFVKAGLYVWLFYLLIKSPTLERRKTTGSEKDVTEPEKVKTG